jgi:serine/threonine-protein kinase
VWAERAASAPALYGIAHGSAGLLYATLRWSAATGAELPPAFAPRLEELAAAAVERRGAACWPHGPRQPTVWPGWCHGSAGHALLWVLAHRTLGDAAHLELAERAALHAWRNPAGGLPTLCCGLAGQAYAMVALHNATGDRAWLTRAARLARSARDAAGSPRSTPNSLYRGDVGVSLLEAELACPELARMPLFEPTGAFRGRFGTL